MVGAQRCVDLERRCGRSVAPVLELRGLRGPGSGHRPHRASGRDRRGRRGAGNGQSELADVIVGVLPAAVGPSDFGGHDIRRNVRQRAARASPTSPTTGSGGALRRCVHRRQPPMGAHARCPVGRGPRLDAAGAAQAREGLGRVRHQGRPTSTTPLVAVRRQRAAIVVARDHGQRSLIVAAQPTRGIDIAATRFVHDELLRPATGAGILLICADLPEVLTLADRSWSCTRAGSMGEAAPGRTRTLSPRPASGCPSQACERRPRTR